MKPKEMIKIINDINPGDVYVRAYQLDGFIRIRFRNEEDLMLFYDFLIKMGWV